MWKREQTSRRKKAQNTNNIEKQDDLEWLPVVASLFATVCYEYQYSCHGLSSHFYFPSSGQAVVTGVVPSPPRFLPSVFIARRVQQSHCSSIFHRVLLTHALALSASQFVHQKRSERIFTSLHSAGLELTKLTYTRLEDNLIRHRGDRYTLRGIRIVSLVACMLVSFVLFHFFAFF